MACGNVLTAYLDSAIMCGTKLVVVPLVWIDSQGIVISPFLIYEAIKYYIQSKGK